MKLYYKSIYLPHLSSSPLILISDIDGRKNDGTLVLQISGLECTYTVINGKRYKLTSGSAKIPLSELQNGVADVIFVSGTKRLIASPFYKSESVIERVLLESETAKAIERLLVSIAERIDEMEKRISSLEKKTVPAQILKFS